MREMNRKIIPYGTKLPVKLTLRERELIRDETFCDPDFAKCAVVQGKWVVSPINDEFNNNLMDGNVWG